jgi:hypothetical protein
MHPGQNGHMQNHPSAVPPRSVPTPQQFGGNPMQPNQPFQQNPANQEGRHFPPIPPLEKGRFDTVYKNFCAQRSLVHNPRMLTIESRPLDLYDLHTQVMIEGGAANVRTCFFLLLHPRSDSNERLGRGEGLVGGDWRAHGFRPVSWLGFRARKVGSRSCPTSSARLQGVPCSV